jgi:hypothetical protein
MDIKLRDQLVEAEARVEQIKHRINAATCVEAGHDWRHVGGRNAGCDRDCSCSVPVHECAVCGDSDYGDNAEANATLARCAAGQQGEGA